MATQVDSFPTGIIDAIGEFKEVTLSEEPGGDVTVAWERTVSAGTGDTTVDCQFPSASASLELTIFLNGASQFTRTYSAFASGANDSDSDSGPDSGIVSGASKGDVIRIEVTDRSVSVGCNSGAGAQADPGDATYEFAPPRDGDLDEDVPYLSVVATGTQLLPTSGDLLEDVPYLGVLAAGTVIHGPRDGDLAEDVPYLEVSGVGNYEEPLGDRDADLSETVPFVSVSGVGDYVAPVTGDMDLIVPVLSISGVGSTSPWTPCEDPDDGPYSKESPVDESWESCKDPSSEVWNKDMP